MTVDKLYILLTFFADNISLFYAIGAEIDLVRARLKADEQMCWYFSSLLTCLSSNLTK